MANRIDSLQLLVKFMLLYYVGDTLISIMYKGYKRAEKDYFNTSTFAIIEIAGVAGRGIRT